MARLAKKRKGKTPKRKLDLTAMKEALKDDRLFPALGIVTDEDGSHFSLSDEDLIIEVEIVPSGEIVSARQGFGSGSLGTWKIPSPGTEVALLIPDGSLEFGPIIVGILSTGGVPQGLAEGITIITDVQNVFVTDGGPLVNADSLVKAQPYDIHTHPSGMGPTGIPSNSGTAGTTVLKGQ